MPLTFTPGTATEFAAARHLLSTPTFAGRFDAYMNEGTNGIAWHEVLDEPVSDGENVLIELAHCLFVGRGGPEVSDLIAKIDEDCFYRALEAIHLRRSGALL